MSVLPGTFHPEVPGVFLPLSAGNGQSSRFFPE